MYTLYIIRRGIIILFSVMRHYKKFLSQYRLTVIFLRQYLASTQNGTEVTWHGLSVVKHRESSGFCATLYTISTSDIPSSDPALYSDWSMCRHMESIGAVKWPLYNRCNRWPVASTTLVSTHIREIQATRRDATRRDATRRDATRQFSM